MIRFLFLFALVCLDSLSFGQSYEFEPLDAIRISCPSMPSLQAEVMLDSIGVASLPIGKKLVLAGLTPAQAEAKVGALYRSISGALLADLRLEPVSHPLSPVRWSGAVDKAGSTFASKGLLLSDVLARCAPTSEADLGSVEVFRAGGRVTVRAEPSGDPSSWDLELVGGDKVYLPRAKGGRQVYVLGAVARPGAIEFTRGMTAKHAIEKAGGAGPQADLTQVQVERMGRVQGLVDLNAGDPFLEPGDSLTVKLKAAPEYVLVTGGVMRPGRIFFRPGMTLREAVRAVGGLKPNPVKGKVRIVRTQNGKTTQESFDSEALFTGRIADPILKPGDRIEVPERR